MKQGSAIFIIFLIVGISHEKELNTKNNNLIKEKISPALIEKTIIQATQSLNDSASKKEIKNQESTNFSSNESKNDSSKTDKNSDQGINSSNNDPASSVSVSESSNNTKSNLISINQIENLKKKPQSNQSIDIDYSFDNNIKCNANNCYFPNGRCTNNNTTCQCTNEYASFKIEGEVSDHYCAYERKKQLVSFLLEFFFPFGVGHFYAGRMLIGTLKLILLISQCFLGLSIICLGKPDIIVIIISVLGCLYLVWGFTDIILIALNVYKDGNGVSLASW